MKEANAKVTVWQTRVNLVTDFSRSVCLSNHSNARPMVIKPAAKENIRMARKAVRGKRRTTGSICWIASNRNTGVKARKTVETVITAVMKSLGLGRSFMAVIVTLD